MERGARELLLQGGARFGVDLSASQVEKFSLFAEELKKWNRRINLTAIRTDREIALKHFVDSMSICTIVKGEGNLLDLGSGAGFPVIPVALVNPLCRAVSVDAVEKKVIFQRHVGRILGLRNLEAMHARGEELAEQFAGHFDWVVSRAFADIATFVRMALPLLSPCGRIIAMKGGGGREEVDRFRCLLTELDVEVREVLEFTLPISGDNRSLIVMGRRLA